jgi:hypothetical protein
MMLLYVIATIFVLLILGGILNSTGDRPNKSLNLYLALGLWICFIAGGVVYEYHREAFRRIGFARKSVRIVLPLFFLLIIGIPIILESQIVGDPGIRLVFAIIIVLLSILMWRTASMLVQERRKAFLERRF